MALAAIAFELVTPAWIRWRFFATGFLRSFASIALGGAIIASVSAAVGAVELTRTPPPAAAPRREPAADGRRRLNRPGWPPYWSRMRSRCGS